VSGGKGITISTFGHSVAHGSISHTAAPVPVTVVNPPSEPLGSLPLLFTLIASAAAIPATVAGIIAAIYAWKTFNVMTARPMFNILDQEVLIGTAESVVPLDIEISVRVQNDGATTEGTYVDLWVPEDDSTLGSALTVSASNNSQWLRGDSQLRSIGNQITTWTRWTRYFRQHIPGNGSVVVLRPLRTSAPARSGNYYVLLQLRTVDGSQFPQDGSLATLHYVVAVEPPLPSLDT
jgi:hypothetical protein